MKFLPPTFEPWTSEQTDQEIAVLMSGGVDSSVSAIRLQEAGWRVLGLTMKIPAAQACSHPAPCCGADAAIVCAQLSIPHYFLDVAEEFEECVVAHFRQAYTEGRTPNPCVNCNTHLKFGRVWDLVEAVFGIRYLATGHYARVTRDGNAARLRQAPDLDRDQSYFIYGVPATRLPNLELPMGDMGSKSEVRKLAEARGLSVADKPDSMELCFAGEGNYRQALGAHPPGNGPIMDLQGNLLGQHNGIWNYTLGQRRGLGVAAAEPLYVVRVEPGNNTVVVGTRAEANQSTIQAHRLNVLAPDHLALKANLLGKIRSSGSPTPCSVVELNDNSLTVEFDTPQFAPAPGQHLVLYGAEGIVVAGGEITAGNDCT